MDLNGQDLRRYAVGGKLKDLTDQPFVERFRPVGVETYTIGGKLWAAPRGGITGFPFLYNKKALDAIGATKEPETYADLMEMAPELKKAGYAPFVHAGKNIYLWPIWQFFAFAQTTGNKPVEQTYKTLAGDMKFTDPEHVAALEILESSTPATGCSSRASTASTATAPGWPSARARAPSGTSTAGASASSARATYPELDMSLIPPVRSVDDPKSRAPAARRHRRRHRHLRQYRARTRRSGPQHSRPDDHRRVGQVAQRP